MKKFPPTTPTFADLLGNLAAAETEELRTRRIRHAAEDHHHRLAVQATHANNSALAANFGTFRRIHNDDGTITPEKEPDLSGYTFPAHPGIALDDAKVEAVTALLNWQNADTKRHTAQAAVVDALTGAGWALAQTHRPHNRSGGHPFYVCETCTKEGRSPGYNRGRAWPCEPLRTAIKWETLLYRANDCADAAATAWRFQYGWPK